MSGGGVIQLEKYNFLNVSINRENCNGVRWDVKVYNNFDLSDVSEVFDYDSLDKAVDDVVRNYLADHGDPRKNPQVMGSGLKFIGICNECGAEKFAKVKEGE